MTDDQEVQAAIYLGNEAKILAGNVAFKSLMLSFEQTKEIAIKELILINPNDSEKIQELQNTIYCHDEIVARLSTFVESGDILQQEIEDGIY